jgi:hypothetical protein
VDVRLGTCLERSLKKVSSGDAVLEELEAMVRLAGRILSDRLEADVRGGESITRNWRLQEVVIAKLGCFRSNCVNSVL